MEPKNVLLSKTFWVNIIAILALVVQYYRQDFVISPEIQASILAVINIILRLLTKK